MLQNKIFFGAFCMFFMTLCSTPTNNAQSSEKEKENISPTNQTNSGTNNASTNNIVYNTVSNIGNARCNTVSNM
jgi:hypothetical protein